MATDDRCYRRGEKPIVLPEIPQGIWWVRVLKMRYVASTVPSNEPCNDYYTWDGATSEWVLVRNEDGFMDEFGSDEGFSLDRVIEVAVELGAQVHYPEPS